MIFQEAIPVMNTSKISNASIPKIEEQLILESGIPEGDKVGWFKRKDIQ